MAGLGTLGKLGIFASALFGSPEQQRANALSQAKLEEEKKRSEDERLHREEQIGVARGTLAESIRQHQEQFGPIPVEETTGLAEVLKAAGLPPGYRPRRGDIPGIINAIEARKAREAAQIDPLLVDPKDYENVLGVGKVPSIIPGTAKPAETLPFPATPEEPPGEMTIPATPGRMTVPILPQHLAPLVEGQRKRNFEAGKAAAMTRFDAGMAKPGADFETVYRESGLAGFNVPISSLGFRPLAPPVPAKDTMVDLATRAAAGDVAAQNALDKLKPAKPEPNPLDEAYKKLRNARIEESNRVSQSVESIEEKAAQGTATPKELSQAIKDLNANADKDLKLVADGIITGEENITMVIQSAMDQKRRAIALDKFRKGQPATGAGKKGETRDDVVKRLLMGQ